MKKIVALPGFAVMTRPASKVEVFQDGSKSVREGMELRSGRGRPITNASQESFPRHGLPAGWLDLFENKQSILRADRRKTLIDDPLPGRDLSRMCTHPQDLEDTIPPRHPRPRPGLKSTHAPRQFGAGPGKVEPAVLLSEGRGIGDPLPRLRPRQGFSTEVVRQGLQQEIPTQASQFFKQRPRGVLDGDRQAPLA